MPYPSKNAKIKENSICVEEQLFIFQVSIWAIHSPQRLLEH